MPDPFPVVETVPDWVLVVVVLSAKAAGLEIPVAIATGIRSVASLPVAATPRLVDHLLVLTFPTPIRPSVLLYTFLTAS